MYKTGNGECCVPELLEQRGCQRDHQGKDLMKDGEPVPFMMWPNKILGKRNSTLNTN
jgi:hypothetical protein